MNTEGIERESSSVVWPVLLSGAIGAGLALLLTPKSGKDIRSDISRIARRTAESPSETMEEAQSAASAAIESAQQPLAEAASESGERSLVVPILISGVVGAAVALLFAPKPGTEVMTDIKDLASSAVDKGKVWYEQGAAKVKEAVEKGKEAVEKEKIRTAA
jgi:gas vesicle protein